jgi:hypothetical protein
MEYPQPLMRYTHTNNSLLSSGNTKKSTTYEPRTEAISPAINDDILNAEDSTSKSTKDEQTLIVEKLKKVEADILQTDLHIVRLRRQKEQLEQAANNANKDDDDQENVCDTKQLSIAKLVYHENRSKAQRAHSKLDCLGYVNRDLPIYNQPTDNAIYHHNAAKFNFSFKASLVTCFRARQTSRLQLEESVSAEYDRRMEKWLKGIEAEDSQPSKRIKDARAREFFEKQFPELKKARESGERFSRVGQRVARSDAEVAELLDGITEREDQDKKVKSYAVIPPMLEEMRSKKPKFFNRNGYVEDIIAEYKEYQILNTWTDEEKDIFRENYLQHPKDFGLISRMATRKNVANCVHYYYLSKKSENYKQLLKRQQKRRTRSFVRPAQATPANTSAVESNESNSKSANNNEKQAGDSVMADASNSSETNDGKFSALVDKMRQSDSDNLNANESNHLLSSTCCVCNCNFDASNQSRNVTRSNHQIYGIGIELLKPGLKICYSCRFRHVNYPSFDELSYSSKEPIELHPTEMAHHQQPIFNDMMEVDYVPETEIDEKPPVDGGLTNPLNIPPSSASPAKEMDHSDLPSGPDNGETNQGTKRACVRDIIYQAIEMSFQKQEVAEPSDTQPKIEPIAPILAPHSIQSISGQMYTLPNPNSCYAPVQMVNPRQQLFEESARIRQQQYHMQIRQHQPPPHHIRQQQPQQTQQQPMRQQFPPLMHPLANSTHPIPQQPILARLPGQPFPTTSPQPNSLSPAMQAPHPPHSLLTTVVPISSPHSTPLIRHQPLLKTHVNAANHLPPGAPVAHPLNLCRKFNESAMALSEQVKQQHGKTRPPNAHSGKVGPSPGSIDDGVLNLSAKHQSPASTPLPQPVISQQAPQNAIQQVPPNFMLSTPMPSTQPQPSMPKPSSPQIVMSLQKHSTNTTTISPPITLKSETPTNGEKTHQTSNRAPSPPETNTAISSKGPSPKQNHPASTPPRSIRAESRSPNPIGSPTSPSEMVIDESAEALASPSDHDDDESSKR